MTERQGGTAAGAPGVPGPMPGGLGSSGRVPRAAEDELMSGDVRAWQHDLVMRLLRVLVIIAPVVAAAGSYYDYTRQMYIYIPVYWLAYAALLVVTFWRRVPYTGQVITIVLLLYALGVSDLVSDGHLGSGRIFLLMLPFAASTFYSTRRGLVALALVAATMAATAVGFATGVFEVADPIDPAAPIGWVSNTLVMLLLGAFMVVSHHYLVPRMTRALDEGRRLRVELERDRADLEAQVSRRTADLMRRNVALQAAAQVARDAARIRPEGTRDVEQVIEETVMLVSDAFGYYHCGLFMLEGEWAVLRAASSMAGQAMLAEGHRLPVRSGSGAGVVGSAAASGEAHIALDVGRDAVFFNNPHLPETRSEVAVPLRVGALAEYARPGTRGVIGVLDVQSREAAAFDKEDVVVLQTLADQIALAIANARLVRDLEESVGAEQRAYGALSREDWHELVRARRLVGERYDPAGILAASQGPLAREAEPGGNGAWEEAARHAAAQGRLVTNVTGDVAALVMPVKVRDQVIGVLDARKAAGGPAPQDERYPDSSGWADSELELIRALVDQLGIALDSARMYEETQMRAAHEQAMARVAGRMRESLDVDVVLQRAVQEMRQALGVAEVEVRLGTFDSPPGGGQGPEAEARNRVFEKNPVSPVGAE